MVKVFNHKGLETRRFQQISTCLNVRSHFRRHRPTSVEDDCFSVSIEQHAVVDVPADGPGEHDFF
jgi:hypothetical protein